MLRRTVSPASLALLLASCATLLLPQPVAALNADYWRGGWRTPLGDDPHIYEFVIRGNRVTGVYCRNCSDATTIGFIDGTWNEKTGIDFTITFPNPNGSVRTVDKQHAMLVDGKLIVTRAAGPTGGARLILVKDPRGADPGGAPAYHLPPGTPPALPAPRRGVVDRVVRPRHEPADLHLHAGRQRAAGRGVRALRQSLHDRADRERPP